MFASERHRGHDPDHEIEASGLQTPFEHPGRAEAIRRAVAADGRFVITEPADHGTAPIEAVHDPGLVRFLSSAWEAYQRDVKVAHDVVPDVFAMPGLRAGMGGRPEPPAVAARLGWWCFETTTPLTRGTYDAARSAVDCALAATDAVLDGDVISYGLCRPPGHHATAALYGGYCFFNNAAIAAQHAAAAGGRVAVLDVDYHHGNGTQQIFYEREDVFFASLHGDPVRAYPYHTGYADETGSGRGRGANCNVPLPALTDDDAYLAALDRVLAADRGLRPGAGRRLTRPRHVRRRPDVRPGADGRRLRSLRSGSRRARSAARRPAGRRLRRRLPWRQRHLLAARCRGRLGAQADLMASRTLAHRCGSLWYGA